MSTGDGYLSLLWPCGRQIRAVSDQTWTDLGLDRILQGLSEGTKPNEAIDALLHQLPVDRTTIAYRLAITGDLLAIPALGDTFLSLPPMVGRLRYFALRPDQNDWTPLQEVTWRIRELEHYVGVLDMLHDGFASAGPALSSSGLLALRAMVSRARTSAIFDRIRAELPALLRAAADFRSIAVGVNLGGGLEPVEATILDIGTTPYRGGGLAGRLLAGSDHTGIAQLHTAHSAEYAANPLLVPLFKDLSEILKRAVRPLTRALSEFAGLSSRNFAALVDEVSFYAGAIRLARRLQRAGLPTCSPQLREVGLSGLSLSDGDTAEGRASSPPGPAGCEAGLPAIEARGLYNINLAIARIEATSSPAQPRAVVGSDISLDGGETVAIVTGPNGGGKTTFLQSVGLAQLLSQLGLFAPASQMTLDPVDHVATHFPSLERMDDGDGRFAEEATRLHELLTKVTSRSLILLNETLSSTAMGEAVYIGRDILTLLNEYGCRVVFVTHLHDLAFRPGIDAVSLVAGTEERNGAIIPSFRVERGLPQGKSYAALLADRHGLSLAKLRALRESSVR